MAAADSLLSRLGVSHSFGCWWEVAATRFGKGLRESAGGAERPEADTGRRAESRGVGPHVAARGVRSGAGSRPPDR